MEDYVLAVIEVDPAVPTVVRAGLLELLLESRGDAFFVRSVARFRWTLVEPGAATHLRRGPDPVDWGTLASVKKK